MFAKLTAALKGARKIELFIAAAALALCLLAFVGDGGEPDSGTELEKRMERALMSVEGAGKVTVMITQSEGKIVGAFISAEGADDMRVYLSLLEGARKLLGIEGQYIEITRGGG